MPAAGGAAAAVAGAAGAAGALTVVAGAVTPAGAGAAFNTGPAFVAEGNKRCSDKCYYRRRKPKLSITLLILDNSISAIKRFP